MSEDPMAYLSHWCDIRQRGHYEPCGCTCVSCMAERDAAARAVKGTP